MNNILGRRIKKERKDMGLDQAGLAEKLGLAKESRQTIGAWEIGNRKPPLDALEKMCELFDCDLDYLTGRYECKTRGATDIHEVTGLSENAINALKYAAIGNKNIIIFINALLENVADLHFIASAFSDLSSKKGMEAAIDAGIISDDFGPDTLANKRNIEIARFTLQDRFIRFADKSTTKDIGNSKTDLEVSLLF